MDQLCNFILCEIFSYLSRPDYINSLILTSHRFYQLLHDDVLWKKFYENEYAIIELTDMTYRDGF